MEKKGIPQEMLKLIACASMLLDHVGATVVINLAYKSPAGILLTVYDAPGIWVNLYSSLRLIGRLAFPIYCFLLVEGSAHTKNTLRYGMRLALCALISEIPYDLALHGGLGWQNQNVMVTLFMGFCTLEAVKRFPHFVAGTVAALCVVLAELAGGDYGANGVMLVLLFALTREIPRGWLLQFLGMWFLFSPHHAMMLNWTDGFFITTQEWAVLALIPIHLYSGKKLTKSKAVQWAFYLFYPAHLLVLYGIGRL